MRRLSPTSDRSNLFKINGLAVFSGYPSPVSDRIPADQSPPAPFLPERDLQVVDLVEGFQAGTALAMRTV
jgi:hypothetical protein